MVIPEGLEPPTYRLGICRSILMSYGTTRMQFTAIRQPPPDQLRGRKHKPFRIAYHTPWTMSQQPLQLTFAEE